MTYNINDGVMGIQWGGRESGVSQGAQVITRLSLHLFVGGRGKVGTEYNKVENF